MGAGCSSQQAVATSGEAPQPQQQKPNTLSASSASSAAEMEARRQARMKLMHKCFAALDIENTGMIEIEKWKAFLVGGGVPTAVVDEQAAKLVASMDKNEDDKISLQEFVIALTKLTDLMNDNEFTNLLAGVVNTCREAAKAAGVVGSRASFGAKLTNAQLLPTLKDETRVAKLRLCFQAMDTDRSGFIELGEFKSYVSKTGDGDQAVASSAEALVTKMDADGDKKISMQEFMCSMAEFKNTCSDAAFTRLVEGIFAACSGQIIASNVIKEALDAKLK